jgi:hypothetical protein
VFERHDAAAGSMPGVQGYAGYAQSSMSGGSTNPADRGTSTQRTGPHGMTTFNNTNFTSGAKTSVAPPTNASSPDEIKAWVEHQLDLIGDTPLLDRFMLLGPNERRRGGALLATSAAHLR